MRPLTVEEARAFLAASHDERLAALYVLAISLGLRDGELLALRWDDVDLEARTLSIRHTLGRGGRLAEPKTAHARRTVILSAAALTALRAHRRRQLAERLAAGARWRDRNLAFPSSVGTPLSPRNVVRGFHAALRRAAVPDCRFHDLRHTAATIMLEQGVDLLAVSRVLGTRM